VLPAAGAIAVIASIATPADKKDNAPELSVTASQLTAEQMEDFLLHAKILRSKSASKGITGVVRVTLGDGKITHDAAVQRIDEEKPRFEGTMGVELNFRDTYRFNVGAYRLAKMLGLVCMTPVTVERKFEGKSGSFAWWVDDVMMDEESRTKKHVEPPDKDAWGRQMYIVRVFDQLIYNTDRNLGNLLIDKDWKLWMIDHSRAFRLSHDLQNSKNLVKCDSEMLRRLKELDEHAVSKELKDCVRANEIKGMMARRDKIVAFFENEGPPSLYEWLKR
jgi:hypothetical protein